MKSIHQLILAFLLVASVTFAENLELKVALYPYLPDSCRDNYGAFFKEIKTGFENLYPEVDLVLQPFDKAGDFYNYSYLSSLFEVYDVVESDLLFMGALLASGLTQPWKGLVCDERWQSVPHQYCKKAAGHAYPHWQCAYFAFGHDASIYDLQSIDLFVNHLQSSSWRGLTRLAIDLSGTHTPSNMFVDAVTDWNENNHADWRTQSLQSLSAMQSMKALASFSCTKQGGMPSLNGYYHSHSDVPAKLFANKDAEFYVGASESFYAAAAHMKKNDMSAYAIHVPWGLYQHPTLMVDALFLSKKTSARVAHYAQLFADYLTQAKTYEWIVMGEDCVEEAAPRYLLPATYSAFSNTTIGEDPMMRQYYDEISQSADAMLYNTYSEVIVPLGERLHAIFANTTQCAP